MLLHCRRAPGQQLNSHHVAASSKPSVNIPLLLSFATVSVVVLPRSPHRTSVFSTNTFSILAPSAMKLCPPLTKRFADDNRCPSPSPMIKERDGTGSHDKFGWLLVSTSGNQLCREQVAGRRHQDPHPDEYRKGHKCVTFAGNRKHTSNGAAKNVFIIFLSTTFLKLFCRVVFSATFFLPVSVTVWPAFLM